MKKFALAGIALVAALPAFAQQPSPAKAGPTRAAVQASIQAKFAKVDTDKDGFVSEAEAKAATDASRAEFRALRAESRAELFAKLDTNKDNMLSRAEFEAPPAAEAGQRKDRRADRQRRGQAMAGLMFAPTRFQAMDGNKDGKVSLAEASAMTLARFDRLDANRDGTISSDESRAGRGKARPQRSGS